MVGIRSCGAYIPYYRLKRADIGKHWGGYQLPGEKAVANFDEDPITMSVEAARDCLTDQPTNEITGVYASSTTFEYAEKQNAALIAAVLDIPSASRTIDVAGSLRCGSNAVALAVDAIKAGGASLLVTAADMRLALPNGAKELEFGDGAAALLIGNTDLIATIDHLYTVNNEMYDVFRPVRERFVRSWEDRFVREMGYTKIVPQAVAAALESFGMGPKDFTRAVFASPNPSYLAGVAKSLGFDPKSQVIDPLWNETGNMGTAHGMVLLAAALENANPGEKLLWVTYGDGCDVMALTVTDAVERYRQKKSVQRMISSKAETTYPKYLRWRDLVTTEPPNRPRSEPASAPALARDRKCGLALFGSKCRACGTIQYPVQRVCMECRAKDDFEYYPFADKVGKIVTFSHDNLAVSPDPPTTLAAVDFEEGGRMMLDVTDRDPATVQVGLPVEMTFRKFRYVEGVQVYWWKSRPVR